MIWQALEQLCAQQQMPLPGDAATRESFEADKLNRLLDK
jgi:serine O-acetyltransferase